MYSTRMICSGEMPCISFSVTGRPLICRLNSLLSVNDILLSVGLMTMPGICSFCSNCNPFFDCFICWALGKSRLRSALRTQAEASMVTSSSSM